jgi:hypothetical protein
MLEELEGNGLEVIKVKTDDGYIRVTISQNCKWYRDFCADYQSTRRRHPRPRTFIKRCRTERALRGISQGMIDTEYARRLLPIVQDAAKDEMKQRRQHRRSAQPLIGLSE